MLANSPKMRRWRMLSADSSSMCVAFAEHLQGSPTAEEVRGQV